jgi:dolichol-phosphate mannosyltransferase
VIPTYNEVGTIEELVVSLQELGEFFRVRVVIMDDGSDDGTLEVLEGLMGYYDDMVIVERGEKLGFGSALLEGFRTALGLVPEPEFIMTMDGDLSHDPRELPSLVGSCSEGGVVIGSRYVECGAVEGWGLHRRVVSRVANFLTRRFAGLPVKDCTSGFRCYHSDVVQEILQSVGSSGYDVQIDVLFDVVKRDFEVVEIPIRFSDRLSGKSKLSVREVWNFLGRIILQSRLRHKLDY